MPQVLSIGENAQKIFIFEEVYPFRAAQEQANKKKVNAFGLIAKLNPLNRPKEETVLLQKEELRYEPFWELSASRDIEYTCQVVYPVTVHNPHARKIDIQGLTFDVKQQGDKQKFDVQLVEQCTRTVQFSTLVEGLERDLKPATLENYIKKYKHTEIPEISAENAIPPRISSSCVNQMAASHLSKEMVNAHEISRDIITLHKAYLYFRPVYAFEFVWAPQSKTGVIEVDGLTGEVIENGQWFKEKMSRVMTREMLFEAGAEVAGSLIPGAGLAIKMIDKLTSS
jgi:hypothetical protein